MKMLTALVQLLLVAVAVLTPGVSGRMAGRLPGGFGRLSTNFNCDERPFGYYADVDHGCRAFHVCMPVYTEDGLLDEVAHFSFMCGQNALFSQDSLTCAHPTEALPCEQAAAHYTESNAEFGIVPEENLDVKIE